MSQKYVGIHEHRFDTKTVAEVVRLRARTITIGFRPKSHDFGYRCRRTSDTQE